MTDPIAHLPGCSRNGADPVFREPWEAKAFALAVLLSEAGHFTWSAWTEALGAELAAADPGGEAGTGADYYQYWVAALEKVLAAKAVLDGGAAPG